jgi:ABC-2 type transport system permease protein
VDEVTHHLNLYRRVVGARIRSDWQYRTSFLTFTVAQALVTGLEFAALLIILGHVDTLGGWTPAQVGFLYGLAAVPFGFTNLITSPVERLADYVRLGDFDRILLRPVSPLVQLMALEFELRRAGKLLPPAMVLGWAVANVHLDWTPLRLAVLVLALTCGTVIYSALWVLAASISFWAVASREATNAFTYGGQFANEYPLHLYRGWIRLVLGWAIPLAYVAYVPAQYLLDAANPLELPPWLVLTTPLVTAATVLVSYGAWRTGIRHYQSTGS